jgi:hypothetical protein
MKKRVFFVPFETVKSFVAEATVQYVPLEIPVILEKAVENRIHI